MRTPASKPLDQMIRIPIDSRPRNFFADCHNWCVENCQDEWTTTTTAVYFVEEKDAILYRLTHVS